MIALRAATLTTLHVGAMRAMWCASSVAAGARSISGVAGTSMERPQKLGATGGEVETRVRRVMLVVFMASGGVASVASVGVAETRL